MTTANVLSPTANKAARFANLVVVALLLLLYTPSLYSLFFMNV